jgi:hypothetical protein
LRKSLALLGLALILTFSPWEKEQHLCDSSFTVDGSANAALDFSRKRRMIHPLLEERAGVRTGDLTD